MRSLWGLMAVAVTAAACSKPSWRPYVAAAGPGVATAVWAAHASPFRGRPLARLRHYSSGGGVLWLLILSLRCVLPIYFPCHSALHAFALPLPHTPPPPLLPPPPILDRRLTHRVCRSALLLGVGPTGSAPSGTHTRPAGRLLSCPFWQGGQTRGRGAASIPRSLWVCRAVSTGPLTQCLFVPPPAIGAPLI